MLYVIAMPSTFFHFNIHSLKNIVSIVSLQDYHGHIQIYSLTFPLWYKNIQLIQQYCSKQNIKDLIFTCKSTDPAPLKESGAGVSSIILEIIIFYLTIAVRLAIEGVPSDPHTNVCGHRLCFTSSQYYNSAVFQALKLIQFLVQSSQILKTVSSFSKCFECLILMTFSLRTLKLFPSAHNPYIHCTFYHI